MLGPRVVDHGLFRVWSDCYPSRDQWCESVGSDALRGLARREDVWLAADLDVGAEGVEPGDLSAVTATLLGAFGGAGRIPTQDRACGSNSSGYNVLAPSRDRRREPNMPTARS